MIDLQNNQTAVVVLSGGLDSTVALAETLSQMEVALVLTFDYGQRALAQELDAASRIAAFYELEQRVVELPWLKELLPKALTPEDQLSSPEEITDENLMETERVWVPNRNGVFLNIAAAFAEARKAKYIVFGANADEAIGFPDNTQAYRDKLTETFGYSTLSKVEVLTPVSHLSKAQIVERGAALRVPLNLIWSCYNAGQYHCGKCPSCLLLKKAIRGNNQIKAHILIH